MIYNVDAAKTEASSRLAVCVAPKIIGTGIEAVLGIRELIRPLIMTDTLVSGRACRWPLKARSVSDALRHRNVQPR
jgi:hypothetical protein